MEEIIINLSEKVFSDIETIAKEMDMTLNEFVCQAIQNKITRETVDIGTNIANPIDKRWDSEK